MDANLTSINIGDVGSNGSFTASLTTDSDGTNSEFEQNASNGGGELDDNLQVGAFIETTGDFNGSVGTSQGGTVSRSSNATNVVGSNTTLSTAVGQNSVSEALNGGATKVLVLNYSLPSGIKNVVQGDSVGFDIQALLEQA